MAKKSSRRPYLTFHKTTYDGKFAVPTISRGQPKKLYSRKYKDKAGGSQARQKRQPYLPTGGKLILPIAMENNCDRGSIDEQVQRAIRVKSSADTWITVTCWITGVVCVVAAPFTLGTSMLAFLAVAPIAAIGCSATENKLQTELLKVIARKGS